MENCYYDLLFLKVSFPQCFSKAIGSANFDSTIWVDAVGPVRSDETAVTLMGNNPTDPAPALEENGFQMRHIVLTAKRR
jgi:hypothetical protein